MKRSAYFLAETTDDDSILKPDQDLNCNQNVPSIRSRCLPLRTKIQMKDDFYDQESSSLAKALLGKILVRKFQDGDMVYGRIVETEAYLGPIDKAAHSSHKRTSRTEPMFMKPGTLYVYSIYGMYCCMNVSSAGDGAAVLFRAIEPIGGISKMQQLRSLRHGKKQEFALHHLCNGPSKLCLAYGIDKSLNKFDLASPSSPIWLEDWEGQQSFTIVTSTRIGLGNRAGEWISAPLRFYIKGCKSVSVVDRSVDI